MEGFVNSIELWIKSAWMFRVVLIIFVSILIYLLFRHLFNYIIAASEKKRGKAITNLESVKGFTKRLFGFIVCLSLLIVLHDVYSVQSWLIKIITILLIIQLLYVLHFLGQLIDEVYSTYEVSKTRPITSVIQVVEILLWVLGGLWCVSVVTQQDPGTLLVSVSALFAALSFVFKDMIVNFVSGLQLTSTDMLKIGDRVILEDSIDGTVDSITVNSVRIKNADQTTTIIPAATMMNEPFKNYRDTVDLNIRRFKRSFIIDAKSVRAANSNDLSFIRSLKIEEENLEDHSNLYLFRVYVEYELDHHKDISKKLTRLVQIKDPTAQGIPLEITAFTTLSDYLSHEFSIRKLMDRLLLKLKDFDLEIYQRPSDSTVHND